MKVRCIEVKTGKIIMLEEHITRNAHFMSKYGYRVEDMKTNPITLNKTPEPTATINEKPTTPKQEKAATPKQKRSPRKKSEK